MRRLLITQSEADLTPHAGLGLIGRVLQQYTDWAANANANANAMAVSPLRSDAIGHRDLLASYMGPICMGKSDFEAIEGLR